jgi:hypothetical protein
VNIRKKSDAHVSSLLSCGLLQVYKLIFLTDCVDVFLYNIITKADIHGS